MDNTAPMDFVALKKCRHLKKMKAKIKKLADDLVYNCEKLETECKMEIYDRKILQVRAFRLAKVGSILTSEAIVVEGAKTIPFQLSIKVDHSWTGGYKGQWEARECTTESTGFHNSGPEASDFSSPDAANLPLVVKALAGIPYGHLFALIGEGGLPDDDVIEEAPTFADGDYDHHNPSTFRRIVKLETKTFHLTIYPS